MTERILVTGGLGFIGAAFVRLLCKQGGRRVIVADAETYAADERRLSSVAGGYEYRRLDITDPLFVDVVVEQEPAVIVHFAAESHVTRSERAAEDFFRTNVTGTERVLEAALKAGSELVVHISTDEVYGPCDGEPFKEQDKAPGEGRATSAYARSKALADDVARAAMEGVPVIIARPTNCFGPWQHPEKAVARWTIRALNGEPIPVWGDGLYVRDWMYVDDACDGILRLIEQGTPGEVYNLAPENSPRTNLEIARGIALAAGRDESAVYLTAYDRPDHDRRYAVDAAKVRSLGWAPTLDLADRLHETVDWYRSNGGWWEPLLRDAESLYEDATVRPT